MLPEFYPCYCEACQRDFANFQPYQIMPSNNTGGQIPMQTKQSTEKQPLDFSSNFVVAPDSPTNLGIGYTQGYLKTQIGKRVRITFLIGTNLVQDRQGTLQQVGISYIIIKDIDTNTSTLCDIYAIKFVTIYP